MNVSLPKLKTGSGAPKPKEPNVIFILASDVLTMPAKNGVVSTSDLILKEGKKGVAVYLTPKSINRFDSSEGETTNEMGGWLSNFVANRPGDDEFFANWLQENLNEGFLILTKECGDAKGTRLQGTPCNPMYMTVEGQDNEEGIMSALTFVSSQRSGNKMIHYRGAMPLLYSNAEDVVVPPPVYPQGLGWLGVFTPSTGQRGGGSSTPLLFSSFSAMMSAIEDSGTTPQVYIYTGGNVQVEDTYTLYNIENKTILSINGAIIEQATIRMRGCENIIWRNFRHIKADQSDGPKDLISLGRNSENNKACRGIWIDHCELDAKTVNLGVSADGTLDITQESDLCLISDCLISNSDKTMLLGADPLSFTDRGKLRVTYARCYFLGNVQRMVLCRFGKPDLVNCIWDYIPAYPDVYWTGYAPKIFQIGQECEGWMRYNVARNGRNFISWATGNEGGDGLSGCISLNNFVSNFKDSDGLPSDSDLVTLGGEFVTWDPLTTSGYEMEFFETEEEVNDYVLEWAGAKYHLKLEIA